MTDDRLLELYRQYGPYIYARCFRLLGDRAAAEDITQETFERVHRHLHKAPAGREALAWVYCIATHCCFTELRKRRRRIGLASLAGGAFAPEPEVDAGLRLADHQL